MIPVAPRCNCVTQEEVALIAAVADRLVLDDNIRKKNSVPYPSVRYGVYQAQGSRDHMEDAYVIKTDLLSVCADTRHAPPCSALFGVFDGHGGSSAAQFASENIARLLVTQDTFPTSLRDALHGAFLQLDSDYFEACEALGKGKDVSGSTALTAVVWGHELFVANAGDCRAVLSQKGKAVELSTDHKPSLASERQRIEACGGWVCSDGYVNGVLGVARGIGDYNVAQSKAWEWETALVTAQPEVTEHSLTSEDEFLLLGSDGLWDGLGSQQAISIARQRLREHNNPTLCAQELVQEALKRSRDNVSALMICFSESPPPKRVYSCSVLSRPTTPPSNASPASGLDAGPGID